MFDDQAVMSKPTKQVSMLTTNLSLIPHKGFSGDAFQYDAKQDSWTKAYGVLSNTAVVFYDSSNMVRKLKTITYYPDIKEVFR